MQSALSKLVSLGFDFGAITWLATFVVGDPDASLAEHDARAASSIEPLAPLIEKTVHRNATVAWHKVGAFRKLLVISCTDVAMKIIRRGRWRRIGR
jgi:hypothetical protein